NRFVMFEDTICFDRQTNFSNVPGCPHVAILVSADGLHWSPIRDTNGVVADLCPTQGCNHAWFPAATRTPSWGGAYHVLGVYTQVAQVVNEQFHLYSCGGLTARMLETQSDVADLVTQKGTNLLYDPGTNLLHALSGGVHWQVYEQAWSC